MSTNTENIFYRGYEAVIGIEVHVQLKTQSKIFSTDSTTFDAGDNENTSPVSVGMPGALPVINKTVIDYAIKAGLALGCQIREKSVFSRKNYFYPDLPKGYQISQYDEPICEHGEVEFDVNGNTKKVKITRAHLEEDAGKSNHSGQYTLINYNRSGVPLLEVVSEPEMHSPQEAAEYCRTIRSIVRYVNVCDGNLEEGSLRCDCNVSVRKIGEKKLGTKVELKNINSFRFVEKAIEFEIQRQIDAIDNNEKIIQETRLYDSDKNRTVSMRTKENAQDYRYFPDPDILPIIIQPGLIQKMKSEIPELPLARAKKYMDSYAISKDEARQLTEDFELATFFEKVGKLSSDYKSAANWIIVEFLKEYSDKSLTLNDLNSAKNPISAERLAELIQLINNGTISGKIAKTVFKDMWTNTKSPAVIVSSQGLVQVSDVGEIEKIIAQIIVSNPSQVAEYKSGKTKVIAFFIGAIMKETKGKANPNIVNEILSRKLSE